MSKYRQPSPLLLVLFRQPSLSPDTSIATAVASILALTLSPGDKTDPPIRRPTDSVIAVAETPRTLLSGGSGASIVGASTIGLVVTRLSFGAEEFGGAFYGS